MDTKSQSKAVKPGRPRDPVIDDAILDATLRQMAEHGYSGMSIAGIAAEAGVTKPTLYRRWSNKADLATAALRKLQTGEPPTKSGDLRGDLVVLLTAFQRNLLRPYGMAMIGMLLSEEEREPALIGLFRERITSKRRAMVRSIFVAALARGELRLGVDIDAVVNMLIGSFYAKYIADAAVPGDWPERIVDIVLRAVCIEPQ